MNKLFIMISSVAIIFIVALVLFLKPNNQPKDSQKTMLTVQNNQKLKKIEGHQQQVGLKDQSKGIEIFKLISDVDLNQYEIPDYIQDKKVAENGESSYFIFDHDILNSIKEGDQLKFELLKFGLNREATVDSVEELEDGAIRWSGHFIGYDEDIQNFTISQILDERYAIMTIFTDQGNFISEIKDGIGIISSSNHQIENDTVELSDY